MAINVVAVLSVPAKDDADRLCDIIDIRGDVGFVGKKERDTIIWLRVENINQTVIDNVSDTAVDGSKRFSIPINELMSLIDDMNAYTYAISELRNRRTYQPCIEIDRVTGVNLVMQTLADARGKVFDKNNGVFL